jgi:hypothetical protein
MGDVIDPGLASSPLRGGPATPILAPEGCDWVRWKGTQDDVVAEIDDHDLFGVPPRTGLGRDRDLAVGGDLHYIAGGHGYLTAGVV